jgi:hypothetical protein
LDINGAFGIVGTFVRVLIAVGVTISIFGPSLLPRMTKKKIECEQ